MKNNVHCFLKD